MKKLILAAAALGAVSLAACETTAPSRPLGPASVAFDTTAFAWSKAPGSGRIDGRLTYRRGPVTYSCRAVVLTPETPWVRQRMMTLYGSTTSAAAQVSDVRARIPAENPNYDAYVRQSPCDANGGFSFSGLPDGAYFVITSALPQANDGAMALMRRVVVRGGAAVRIEL